MTEICKEYMAILKSMNSFEEEYEDCPRGIVDEFHYHIQTCKVCVKHVYYDHGIWKFDENKLVNFKRELVSHG